LNRILFGLNTRHGILELKMMGFLKKKLFVDKYRKLKMLVKSI